MNIYLGLPDKIIIDLGINFVSKEFKQYIKTIKTTLKVVLVKVYNFIGIIEKYYNPVQYAYYIIIVEINGINKEITLQMAFKAINNLTRPDGLIPTLLVYRAYSQMSEFDVLSPTVIQRATAIKKTINKIHKLRVKCQVQDTLNMQNNPNVNAVHKLALNSQVLV